MTPSRLLPSGLRGRLLLTHVLVVLVGLAVLFFAVRFSAQSFFEHHQAVRALQPASGRGPMPGRGPSMDMAQQVDDAFRESLNRGLVLAGVAALVVAVGAGVLIARQVALPVQRMADATGRIAAGNYAERVPAAGTAELHRLADAFNAMAAALENTERRRMELIGDVAHELRTPITTLQGYVEGLTDGVVEPSDRTWATLRAEIARLSRLAADLQELSRAEARQLSLEVRPVDPAAIIRAATEGLQDEFVRKGLELKVTLHPDTPRVLADHDRAVQVLTNLLTNALRYTPPPGRVEVEVGPVGAIVSFQVRDTGAGIAPEHLPHVFERFYRVDKSRSRAQGGSGIGLTIAKALVEAMGGRIRAESPGPGKGATFTFDLPAAR